MQAQAKPCAFVNQSLCKDSMFRPRLRDPPLPVPFPTHALPFSWMPELPRVVCELPAALPLLGPNCERLGRPNCQESPAELPAALSFLDPNHEQDQAGTGCGEDQAGPGWAKLRPRPGWKRLGQVGGETGLGQAGLTCDTARLGLDTAGAGPSYAGAVSSRT